MKNIVTFILLFCSLISYGQVWQPLDYNPDQDSLEYNPLKGIAALFGSDNGFPHSVSSKVFTLGEVMKDNGEDNFANSIDPFLTAEAAAGRYVILQVNVDSGKKINPTTGAGSMYDLPTYLDQVDRVYYLGKPKDGVLGPDDVDVSTTDNIMPYDPTDKTGNPSMVVNYNDDFLISQLEIFIARLGEKYKDDERVFIVHYGTYGIFGEWDLGFGQKFTPGYVENVSESDWVMSDANQEKIINAFQGSFPDKNLVARVPDLPQPQSVGYSDGLYFGASLADAAPHGFFFLPKLKRSNVDENWRKYPIGGEIDPFLQASLWQDIGEDFDYIVTGDTILTKGGPDQNVKDVFEQTHPTFLFQNFMLNSRFVGVKGGVHGVGTDGNANPFAGQSNEAWWNNGIAAVKKTGYTFTVSEFRISAANSKPAIEVNIVNKGVAPIYADWAVEFAYKKPTGEIEILGRDDNWNLRQIQPDVDDNYRSFVSDSTIVNGTYKFMMRIINPYEDLPGAKSVPVRFANSGQDADGSGWLTLGEATISLGALGVIPVAATGVSITPSLITLNLEETQLLTATVSPSTATNKTVTWETSDPSIADIDENGLVSAGVRSGTVTITAYAANGSIQGQATVNVEAYWNIPRLVEAEHFASIKNDIHINNTFLPEGGIHIAQFDFGDEVTYGVEVSEAATFEIDFRMANPKAKGIFDIHIDGVKLETKNLVPTNSDVDPNENGEYGNDSSVSFDLAPGRHNITLTTLVGEYNLNSLNFQLFDLCQANADAGINEGDVCDDGIGNTISDQIQAECNCAGTPPGTDVFWPIPGRVEAEHYSSFGNDAMNAAITTPAFASNVEGGVGYFVGGLDFSERLNYQIEAAQEGAYILDFRVANPQDGAVFNVYIDGALVQANLKLADTDGPNGPGDFGNYSLYVTQSSPEYTFTAGPHTVQFEILQGSFDFNWVEFRLASCPDSDMDGICDTEDQCPELDDSLIGTSCDDQDDQTIADVYTSDCTCEGVPVPSPISFVLINSDTETAIRTIGDGDIIDLYVDGSRLNIEALLDFPAKSVRFDLNDKENFRTENKAPYALIGDNNGNFYNWNPAPGTYVLTATAFSEKNRKGDVLATSTITLEVMSGLDSDDVQFQLIDADNDIVIGYINDGDVLDLSAIGSKINIVAELTFPAGSVRFGLDNDASFRTENKAAYALAGNKDDNYYSWTPTNGPHQVVATAYSGNNASGNLLTSSSVSFEVINGASATTASTRSSELKEDTGALQTMSVAPIPFGQHLVIDLQNLKGSQGEIIISDLVGRTVYSQSINSKNNEALRINTDDFQPGMYILNYRENGLLLTEKIIKP